MNTTTWRFAARAISVLAFAHIGTVDADVIKVPNDYPTITEAIAAAEDGDEVVVRPGRYAETVDFMGKAITVRSQQGPANTIIDGEYTREGVSAVDVEGEYPVIRGFTITRCVPRAIVAFDASLHILDNIIVDNGSDAFEGGGVWLGGSDWAYGCCWKPNIAGNLIAANTGSVGGGVYIEDVAANVRDNVITNNRASAGGGVFASYTDCRIERNIVAHNVAADPTRYPEGGGLFISHGAPRIIGNTIVGNTSVSVSGVYGAGGGLYMQASTEARIDNNLILDNMADAGGGLYALDVSGTNPWTNNTIAYNITTYNWGPAVIFSDGSRTEITLANSIIWHNIGIGERRFIGANVVYSNIQGGFPGEGNVDLDPRIDLRGQLQANSPCIDAGDNTKVHVLTEDHAGNPRFVDDPLTPDSGLGDAPLVDMGAYEYQPPPRDALALDVIPTPLVAGERGTFVVSNGAPLAETYLAFSVMGRGETFVPSLNVTLDLAQPMPVAEPVFADTNGSAAWNVDIPGSARDRAVWFQAAQFGEAANVVEMTVR